MFMAIPFWQYLASMPLYTVLLMLAVEFMRKNYRFAAVFWVLSLFTFPLWFNNLEGWFRWAKTLSVLLPTAFVVGYARIAQYEKRDGWWTIFRKDWVLWFLYAILGLNILEASLKDFEMGNWFNGLSGLILIVTIPLVKSGKGKRYGWKISEEKPGDLIAYTDAIWNFLYTSWNIAFVYAENPGYAASSLCILLAAELYPVIKRRPELYVQARVYTLAIHILIRATYDIFTPIMDSSAFASQNVVFWWGIVNFSLHLPYLIWYFFLKKTEK